MKRILAVLLAATMVFALVGCGGGGSGSKVVKIGVFQPQSGDNGAAGKQEILGIEYAHSLVPTVEIGGETYDVELVIVDNQSTTDKATSAAQELVGKDVSVVLGSYGSGASIAGGPVFQSAKVPAIGCSCTNPSVTVGNPYYYRVCYTDPFQGTVMANFAKDEFAAEKVYVLTQLGDDYSAGLSNYFIEAFEGMGGECIQENFPEGTSDFSALITNAINSGADVIFAPVSLAYVPLVIQQVDASGTLMPILAGDTFDHSLVLEAQNGTGIPIYCSTFFDESDEGSVAAEFVTGFKAWLNENEDKKTNNGGNDIIAACSALAYDSYMVAIEAIKAAGSTSGEDIQAALADIDMDAVTGHITFNEEGDANKDMAYIKQANDGVYTFVKIQTVADMG